MPASKKRKTSYKDKQYVPERVAKVLLPQMNRPLEHYFCFALSIFHPPRALSNVFSVSFGFTSFRLFHFVRFQSGSCLMLSSGGRDMGGTMTCFILRERTVIFER